MAISAESARALPERMVNGTPAQLGVEPERGRRLQYTGQQIGSSLGAAVIGAIVLIGLTSTFLLALISLGFTRELPHERPTPRTNRDPAAVPT